MSRFSKFPVFLSWFLISLLFAFPRPCSSAVFFDHSLFDQLLKKYIQSGEIDYASMKQDDSLLRSYLEHLQRVEKGTLAKWPREERMAFWLNAYHAALLSVILEYYPIHSTQEIPGLWDLAFFKLSPPKDESVSASDGDGAEDESSESPVKPYEHKFSLNQIHHKRLIDVFMDEKIHLAISRASVSEPQFPSEAFTGPSVEGQLFLATRRFVNHPKNVRIDREDKKVYLSKIFHWHKRDFVLDFGRLEKIGKFSTEDSAVMAFIAHYLEDSDGVEFLLSGNYKIKKMPFDWKLNDSLGPNAA